MTFQVTVHSLLTDPLATKRKYRLQLEFLAVEEPLERREKLVADAILSLPD